MADIRIENYDLKIIDFNELFIDTIQYRIIDTLHEFGILHNSLSNANVKKFFFHTIIFEICEKVLEKKSKSIIYFNNTQLDDCELMKYFKEYDILISLTAILRKIEKLLPIKFYISKYSIEYLNHLIEKNDGKAQTTINSMISKVNSLDISKFTFNNIKKFTKKYDLTFLNKDYFNRLSTKLLLIR